MDMQVFLSELMDIIGTYSLLVGLALLVLCLISEVIAIGIPFAIETALMLVGYYGSNGNYSYCEILLIIAMTMVGRLLGVFILYSLARKGKKLIDKSMSPFYLRFKIFNNAFFKKVVDRVDKLTPFSVAMVRFLCLSYPLTLMMAAREKLKVLILGTLLNGIIYDVIFILTGAIMGANTKLELYQIVIYFIAGLTTVYIVYCGIQYLIQKHFH